MILQSLCNYYDRLFKINKVPEYGMSPQKINYALVINSEGELISPYVRDLQSKEGKRVSPRLINVPKIGGKRTSGIKPYFLWDKSDYLLGFTVDEEGNFIDRQKHFEASKKLHNQILNQINNPKAKAVLSFFEKWNPQNSTQIENWIEMGGKNFVFQLKNEHSFIHQDKTIAEKWKDFALSSCKASYKGECLITGKIEGIPPLHPPIKGVQRAHTSGAGIVAINKDKTAFCSYGKEQAYNSPVSRLASFKYTTALNYVLDEDNNQKVQVGDTTLVFWSEHSSPLEGMLGQILEPDKAELEINTNISLFLEALREGKQPQKINTETNFYILGLSPNGPRLSVRFWYVCSVGELEERIGQHFRDLQLQRNFDSDPKYPGIRRILKETQNKKSKKAAASPLLEGALMKSILTGTAYPQNLQNAIINRIRADRNINYVRAGVLKAILNRKNRIYKTEMEVTMQLDKENKNPAYLLGRLFAVLEKTQKDALGQNLDATIKDRFFSSASANPKAVFPQLLRLSQHHIQKAEYGHFDDKLIEEIVCELEDFPAHLSLDQQGLFVIGYYHQRQNLFQKRNAKNKDN